MKAPKMATRDGAKATTANKYAALLKNGGDKLIGIEIAFGKKTMVDSSHGPADSARLFEPEVLTVDSTVASPSANTSSYKQERSLLQCALALRQARSRPLAVPSLDLINVSFCESQSSPHYHELGDATQISSDSDKVGELVGIPIFEGLVPLGAAEDSIEVLMDRRKKRSHCFFPPSARSCKSESFSFERSVAEQDIKQSNTELLTEAAPSDEDKRNAPPVNRSIQCGDKVDVIAGEHKGKRGTVVYFEPSSTSWEGDRVHVFVDFNNETWSMPLENIQPHVPPPVPLIKPCLRRTTKYMRKPLHSSAKSPKVLKYGSISTKSNLSVVHIPSPIASKKRMQKNRSRNNCRFCL